MEDLPHAIELAELMVDIGKQAGKQMAALITDMSQPLGYAVGNALEVQEAIQVLRGEGPADITDLSRQLASYMVFLGGKAASPEEALVLVDQAWKSGAALEKLSQFIAIQGGNPGVIQNPGLFPQPDWSFDLVSQKDGFVTQIDAKEIGFASQHAGAGRARKEDPIDVTAGITMTKKVGDSIAKGEVIGKVCGMDRTRVEEASGIVLDAITIGQEAVSPPPLIHRIIL